VLAAIVRLGHPVRVELGSGIFCPDAAQLFLGGSCPGGALFPPGGGETIGSALVTFAGSTKQAYINLARDAIGVHAYLVAVASPPPTSSPS